MEPNGPIRSRRFRFECTGRTPEEVALLIGSALDASTPGPDHIVLILDHLRQLKGSIVDLFRRLTPRLVSAAARVCIVDPTGLASSYFDAHAPRQPLVTYTSEMPLANSRRVLIVEDDEDHLDFLRTLIESAGHSCEIAGSVAEARQKLGAGAFDLVLLDLVLPDRDGLEIALDLRKLGSETPVIAMSGHLDGAREGLLEMLNIRHRLAKPLRPREVLEAVQVS